MECQQRIVVEFDVSYDIKSEKLNQFGSEIDFQLLYVMFSGGIVCWLCKSAIQLTTQGAVEKSMIGSQESGILQIIFLK